VSSDGLPRPQRTVRHGNELLSAVPRVRLAALPTPLTHAPRFGAAIGADVWIKRDDIGSLGIAGNKIRKLEFLLAEAVEEGADTIVTLGTRISNSARAAAAACAQLGLRCVLVLGGDEPAAANGNLLLDTLFGAEIRYQPEIRATGAVRWDQLDDANRQMSAALIEEGLRPYVLPVGCSSPRAVLGFVAGYFELLQQLEQLRLSPSRLYHASTSGGTHAGLVLGHWLTGLGPRPYGIAAADNVYPDMALRYAELVHAGGQLIGTPTDGAGRLVNLDTRFLGPGYGIVTDEGLDAVSLLARTEGILSDPVYTAKALAALIAAARGGELTEPVVFWHTGGSPGVFEPDYAHALWEHSRVETPTVRRDATGSGFTGQAQGMIFRRGTSIKTRR
jgi:1-aminocyclopropane-1-carboxylate deaminase/D-cysteine desulfhydrase-like pyridoxal-dependent ACC family enzyme